MGFCQEYPGVAMSDEDVFARHWVLTEDELLRMLWRCQAGENPDVVLIELHVNRANRREDRRHRPHRFGGRSPRHPRTTRHVRRNRQQDGDPPRDA